MVHFFKKNFFFFARVSDFQTLGSSHLFQIYKFSLITFAVVIVNYFYCTYVLNPTRYYFKQYFISFYLPSYFDVLYSYFTPFIWDNFPSARVSSLSCRHPLPKNSPLSLGRVGHCPISDPHFSTHLAGCICSDLSVSALDWSHVGAGRGCKQRPGG